MIKSARNLRHPTAQKISREYLDLGCFLSRLAPRVVKNVPPRQKTVKPVSERLEEGAAAGTGAKNVKQCAFERFFACLLNFKLFQTCNSFC